MFFRSKFSKKIICISFLYELNGLAAGEEKNAGFENKNVSRFYIMQKGDQSYQEKRQHQAPPPLSGKCMAYQIHQDRLF
jgi:hypothetical protein